MKYSCHAYLEGKPLKTSLYILLHYSMKTKLIQPPPRADQPQVLFSFLPPADFSPKTTWDQVISFLTPSFSPVYSLHEYLNRVRLHYYRWQNTTLLSIFFLSHISLLLQSAVCSRRHLQRHHWHIHLSPDTLIHTPQRKASHSLSHSCVSYQYKDGVLFPVLIHQAYFRIGLDLDLS